MSQAGRKERMSIESDTADLEAILHDAFEATGEKEDVIVPIIGRIAERTRSMVGRGIAESILEEDAQLDATDALTEAFLTAINADDHMREAALGIIRFHRTRPEPDFSAAPLPEDLETWALALVGLESPNVVRFNGEVTTALLETALTWVNWGELARRLMVLQTA